MAFYISISFVQNKAFPCVFTAMSLSSFSFHYIYIYRYIYSWIKSAGESIQYDRVCRSSQEEFESLHDFAGRYRCDELKRNLCVGQDVLGVAGPLLDVGEDEGGPACRGDDTVWGPRRLHRGHHGTARVHAFFVLMSFNVLCQVVAPHEALGTFRADKLLLSCRRQESRRLMLNTLKRVSGQNVLQVRQWAIYTGINSWTFIDIWLVFKISDALCNQNLTENIHEFSANWTQWLQTSPSRNTELLVVHLGSLSSQTNDIWVLSYF